MVIEKILRQQTMNLFSDEWYKKTSILIDDSENTDGFVYFVRNGKDSKYVKIGMTANINSRMRSFKTVFEKGVFIIGFIKTPNPFTLEKEFHNDYNNKRTKGEFFQLTATDIYNIKDAYDFKMKNDYYKKTSVEEMEENVLVLDFDMNLIDLVKNDLKLNKKYKINEVMGLYQTRFGLKYNKSSSWFGRDLSAICSFLGITRVDSNKKGSRYFELIWLLITIMLLLNKKVLYL